jgi:putative salt-induced outer membrane protein
MTVSPRLLVPALALALSLPVTALAQNSSDSGGWSGSGEFGFALARGNSHTENLNAKLNLKQENELWKNNFYLTGLRSKGDVTVIDPDTGDAITQFSTTANRYELGASVGYKFDPRSYLVSALRYDHDDFGSNRWQGVLSLGYGHILLKNARTELSFEIGPGYKRYQPAYTTAIIDGHAVKVRPAVEHEMVARGLANWKHQLGANTQLEETLLIEAGSKNNYFENDLGLSVSMTKKLALKLAYQVRYNSHTPLGTKSTDQLYTTNLVYNF